MVIWYERERESDESLLSKYLLLIRMNIYKYILYIVSYTIGELNQLTNQTTKPEYIHQFKASFFKLAMLLKDLDKTRLTMSHGERSWTILFAANKPDFTRRVIFKTWSWFILE